MFEIMNEISWAALAIILIVSGIGFFRGLVKTLYSTFSVVIVVVLTSVLSPYAAALLADSPVKTAIASQIEKTFLQGGPGTDAQSQFPALMMSSVPATILDVHGITNYLAEIVIKAMAFVVVFIILSLLLKIAATALDLVSKLPVLNSVNHLGGLIVGFINSIIILWILCIVITLISGTAIGAILMQQLNESIIWSILYKVNILMILLLR